MNANHIRLGETGFEELLVWLHQSDRPQSLDTLTYQYIAILRQKVVGEQAPSE